MIPQGISKVGKPFKHESQTADRSVGQAPKGIYSTDTKQTLTHDGVCLVLPSGRTATERFHRYVAASGYVADFKTYQRISVPYSSPRGRVAASAAAPPLGFCMLNGMGCFHWLLHVHWLLYIRWPLHIDGQLQVYMKAFRGGPSKVKCQDRCKTDTTIYIYMHICMYVCIYTYIHIYICLHISLIALCISPRPTAPSKNLQEWSEPPWEFTGDASRSPRAGI